LRKPNLVIREHETFNKQEFTINIGDPESRGIIAFENNQLYDKYHFIISSLISRESFKYFVQMGNIGLNPEERASEINELQKILSQMQRERVNARAFYNSLPEDASIGNK